MDEFADLFSSELTTRVYLIVLLLFVLLYVAGFLLLRGLPSLRNRRPIISQHVVPGLGAAQSSIAKYMVKRDGPPSQGWCTFLWNHAPDTAAMDQFVVPTIGFDLLYAFIIVRLDRRDLVWINVTKNLTAEWIAGQLAEAFPWDEAPRHLIRDQDRIYGTIVTRGMRAMGIRDKPTAPASPWQNGCAERLIGSSRHECVDHFVVLGEAHLRRILRTYMRYYNRIRTHRSLDKNAPVSRPVQWTGIINSHAILGGLHHHYIRT
jgi:transposase InsO family protein